MTATSTPLNLPRVQCAIDQAEAQYNLRVAFPDFPEVLKTWQEATRKVHARYAPECGLRYGAEALQDYDYFSSGKENAPLLVFVHGGYWQSGDKSDVGFIVEPFVAAGFDAAVLNYRLAPSHRLEDMVEDVMAALRHLHASRAGGSRRFNPQRVALLGHSAGGHLVAMAASLAERYDIPAPSHSFPISGLFDLPPLLPSSVNNALGLDETRATELSPLLLPAPAKTEVHTLIGEHETAQFHEQARILAQVWPVRQHHIIADTHHFTVLNVLADPDQKAVRAMIDSVLNS